MLSPGSPSKRGPIPNDNQAYTTRDLILLEAAILFAQRGYADVSVRDIAKRVDIKAASIYNHFENKNDLLDSIVEHVRELYLSYYERLGEKIRKAGSFDEVLECMFAELKEIFNIFIYYGGSMIQTEQFRDSKCYEVYNDILLKYGHDYVKKCFDDCVERKWVEPFDTAIVSTILMHSVLVGTTMRAHEDMGQETAYNVTEMFESLQKFISDSVKRV